MSGIQLIFYGLWLQLWSKAFLHCCQDASKFNLYISEKNNYSKLKLY